MRRCCLIVMLFRAATVLSAAEFHDFQAARAVFGQASFSGHDKTLLPRALSLASGNLYVADSSGSVLSFDVSEIGAAKTPGCPVCVVSPHSITQQKVFPGVSAVAVHGSNIVIADATAHRVLIWNGVSTDRQPDVILSGVGNPTSVALDGQRLFVGDSAGHHVYIWNALPSYGSQSPDTTLGVTDVWSDGPGADTIQSPAALASDGANLFVADESLHRILVFSPANGPAPQAVNAATLLPGPLAPGTLLSLDSVTGKNPAVFLNGAPLPLTDGSTSQLQVQIPYDLNTASAASLWIAADAETGTATSVPVALRFTTVSPGIFGFGATEPRTGLLLHAPANVPLSPEDPAKPGELLTVWAAGLGAVSAEPDDDGSFETLTPVRVTINGNPVEVISAALPAQSTGVYEVRVRVPAQLQPGASAGLVLLQNDSRSNSVTFPVASK